ncbi:IS3 family transposase [Streptomyces sp. NEAU-W12]|uniref:IS3 family transposase n=1 Tax=Streptomyces sp. NEAU-W12 TaxID=2994668 RepID=UPI003A4C5946
MPPGEKEELKRLRREKARPKEDNEILRKAAALSCTGDNTVIHFRFVDEYRNAHKAERMRNVLGWDRSGSRTWHQDKGARQGKAGEEENPTRRIREIHTASHGACGARRITQEPRGPGCVVHRRSVARIMREYEITGTTRRRSRSLTKQDRTAPPAPDLIQRDFTAPAPGLKPVGDITCLPTAEAWLYPATVIDLCPREVVSWSTADHLRTELVTDAVRMVHAGGRTAGDAIFRPDRGPHCFFHRFRGIMAESNMRQSTGRTGSRFDDAAESFYTALRAEIGTTVRKVLDAGPAGRSPADRETLQPGADPLDDRLHHPVPGEALPPSTAWPCCMKRKCRDPRGHFALPPLPVEGMPSARAARAVVRSRHDPSVTAGNGRGVAGRPPSSRYAHRL